MSSQVKSKGETTMKRRRIDFGNDVTVLVGKEKKRFIAHKSILCETSEFFTTACSGNWLEAKDKIVRLPEHAPQTFEMYLHWRYNAHVDLWNGAEQIGTYTDVKGKTYPSAAGRWIALVDCYILGDILRDRKFCNALIDSWFELRVETNTCPSNCANTIFSNLPASSKLRRLIADELAFFLRHEVFTEVSGSFTADVLKGVADVAVVEGPTPMEKKLASGRGRCYYHEHIEGEEKCV